VHAVYGNLPTKTQLADWDASISQHSVVPEGVLVCLLSFLETPLANYIVKLRVVRILTNDYILVFVVPVFYCGYDYESAFENLR
jgi:hypothetical protein